MPILESFDIKDNFGTKKRTKRLYKVNLSKDLKNMMFTGYNLIDLRTIDVCQTKGHTGNSI